MTSTRPVAGRCAYEAALRGYVGRLRGMGRHRLAHSLGLLCGYVLVSVWLWRSLEPHLATHALGSGPTDPGLLSGG